jgi:hypothetical protein
MAMTAEMTAATIDRRSSPIRTTTFSGAQGGFAQRIPPFTSREGRRNTPSAIPPYAY